jgi:hypothetical protein
MKRHRSWIVIALLISALILGACNPLKVAEQIGQGQQEPAAQPVAGQAAQQQPQATATPKQVEPTATPEPEAEPEDEEEVGPVFSLEEAGITSYRQRLINEVMEDGETTTTDMLIEYSAEGPATRTLVTGSTGEDSFESIRIGDITYMRGADGEWFTMQIVGEELVADMLGMMAWAEPESMLNNDACDYKGQETIEGQRTKHYHCDKSVFMGQELWTQGADAKLDEAYVDYYLSTEFNVTIKSVVHWEGTSENKPFSYHMEWLVTEINEPIVIEAPEGVAAPGVDDDIPIPENATQVTAMMSMTNFTVPDPAADVTAWYQGEMPGKGWTLDPDSSMEMGQMSIQNWLKDGRTANIMISGEDDDETNVVISVVSE